MAQPIDTNWICGVYPGERDLDGAYQPSPDLLRQLRDALWLHHHRPKACRSTGAEDEIQGSIRLDQETWASEEYKRENAEPEDSEFEECAQGICDQ